MKNTHLSQTRNYVILKRVSPACVSVQQLSTLVADFQGTETL